MAQFVKNSTNYHGARSKTDVVEKSGKSRKGKKNRHNSNSSDNSSSWEAKKNGGYLPEHNRSSRNGDLDSWDDTSNKGSNWDDGWTTYSNSRNKKQDSWPSDSGSGKKGTVWDNIEQEFPSLGTQSASQPNVWKERQKKFEEVKSLEPTNEQEEERMMKLALELSKQETQSLDNQKRLEEEYRLQEAILRQNPSEFKEFLLAEELNGATNVETSFLPESENNWYSEGYATATVTPTVSDSSSNSKNWNTWNDYSADGNKKNKSNKPANLKNNTHWNESPTQNASKHKESESVWGTDQGTNHWEGSSDKNNSLEVVSSRNNDSYRNDRLGKKTKSKQSMISTSKDTEGIWGSDSGSTQSCHTASNSETAQYFKETLNTASQLEEFPKPKKTTSKHKESEDTWGSQTNSGHSGNWDDNSDAREKRNYSNLDFVSSSDQGTNNKSKNNSKVYKQTAPVNTSEDVRKVVDMFGGWASASDFAKKPSAKIKTTKNTEEISSQNVSYEETRYPSKPNKLSMQEAPLKPHDESFHHNVSELEEKAGKLNLSTYSNTSLKSQSYSYKGEIDKDEAVLNHDFVEEDPIPNDSLDCSQHKTYSEAPDKHMLPSSNEWATNPNISSSNSLHSDVNKFVNSPASQSIALDKQSPVFSSGINEPIKANNQSVAEMDGFNAPGDAYSDLNVENNIPSPKPASAFLPAAILPISEPVESPAMSEKMKFPIFTSQSISPSSEAFQTAQSNINSESHFNLPSTIPHPVDLPSTPMLPINPMLSGLMNPAFPGINPMMAGVNPLMMQQMLFFSNPFLAKQLQAMDMYYRSLGIPMGAQGINPLLMHQNPGINVNPYSNPTQNVENTIINPPVPAMNCDISAPVPPLSSDIKDFESNSPGFSQNKTKEFYDPNDADSLLNQFLSEKEPHTSDSYFIPPPVEPSNYQNQSSSVKTASYNSVANSDTTIAAPEFAKSGNETFSNESIDVPKSTSWRNTHNISAKDNGWNDSSADSKRSGWAGSSGDYKSTGWAGGSADNKSSGWSSGSADSKSTGWAGGSADSKSSSWIGASADNKSNGWAGGSTDSKSSGWAGASADSKSTGWGDINKNVASSPKTTGWGDIESKTSGINSNWDDDIDGWGNENVTTKSISNPSEYESRKRGVNRQPSSHSTFSRYKK